MARNFARVFTDVWADEEWRSLGRAQHLYLALISQPKLSLAGCLDLKPRVWAAMTGMSERQVNACLADLEAAGQKVVVDRETDELVIRTFVKNDKVLANQNLAKGMWKAWEQIESPTLRQVVIDNLPDEAWKPEFEPRCEPPFRTTVPDHGSEPRS